MSLKLEGETVYSRDWSRINEDSRRFDTNASRTCHIFSISFPRNQLAERIYRTKGYRDIDSGL